MRTDMARGPLDARSFLVRTAGWGGGLFALLRLPWTEAHLLLPVVSFQGRVAADLFGAPARAVVVTLACSGAEALALCLAAIVAYPAGWGARASGVAGATALVLALNTVRIGSLGRVAASSGWFDLLHLYLWPAVLTLAIAGYVFTWMHLADRPALPAGDHARGVVAIARRPAPHRRFIVLTMVFLVVFALTAPLYLKSTVMLAVATFVAGAAAWLLNLVGVTAHASANALWTPRGGFVVTQECLSTPLIPIYLATVAAFARTSPRQVIGVMAAVPLFVALGVARLLVVALPGAFGSPLFLVHAFYQLLLGAVLVGLAACWRHGGRTAAARTLVALAAGAVFVVLLGPLYMRALASVAPLPGSDPQGAIAFLPAFQVGLYLALWVAAPVGVSRRWAAAGLVLLASSHVAGLLALPALATHAGWISIAEVRGWAIVGPVIIAAVVARHAPAPE
ncbi:MAG: hypothetical protein ABIX28_23485 [Vicinamibacterales bacterium]